MNGNNRNDYALILRRIAGVSQTAVSQATGLSTSQVSRIVSGEAGITLERLPALLQSLGLNLVCNNGSEIITTTIDEYQALITMASQGVQALKEKLSSRESDPI